MDQVTPQQAIVAFFVSFGVTWAICAVIKRYFSKPKNLGLEYEFKPLTKINKE